MGRGDGGQAAVGRPRRFDDVTERGMLIDAAVRVMARDEDSAMSLNDVLAEAGLSTRAFYRHFDSKEALLETLVLREAEAVARSLTKVVRQAPGPVAAVEAWLDRFLDIFHEPRRAERAALVSSAVSLTSRPSAQLMAEMRRMSCAPLAEALRAGHADGSLHSPVPEADAYCIYELVATGRTGMDPSERTREVTRAHVLRFAWPALGLQP